jgi:hypothetical protein
MIFDPVHLFNKSSKQPAQVAFSANLGSQPPARSPKCCRPTSPNAASRQGMRQTCVALRTAMPKLLLHMIRNFRRPRFFLIRDHRRLSFQASLETISWT